MYRTHYLWHGHWACVSLYIRWASARFITFNKNDLMQKELINLPKPDTRCKVLVLILQYQHSFKMILLRVFKWENVALNWSYTSIPISFQKKYLTYEYDPVLKRWNYTSNFHRKKNTDASSRFYYLNCLNTNQYVLPNLFSVTKNKIKLDMKQKENTSKDRWQLASYKIQYRQRRPT